MTDKIFLAACRISGVYIFRKLVKRLKWNINVMPIYVDCSWVGCAGYKARFGDLQVTVAANVGELKTLSADYQVSRTRVSPFLTYLNLYSWYMWTFSPDHYMAFYM